MRRWRLLVASALGSVASGAIFAAVVLAVAIDREPVRLGDRPFVAHLLKSIEPVTSPPTPQGSGERLKTYWSVCRCTSLASDFRDEHAKFQKCNAQRLTRAASSDPACRNPLGTTSPEPEAPSRTQLTAALHQSLRDELSAVPVSGVRGPR